jgi:hypothetical protein
MLFGERHKYIQVVLAFSKKTNMQIPNHNYGIQKELDET